MKKTDLQQLAVRRDQSTEPIVGPRSRVVSRYVLPGALICGFLAVMIWAARDTFLPKQPVTVVPVLVSLSEVQQAGTPLFKAAGWVEPRPTPIRVAALAPGVIDRLLVVEDQPVKKGEPIAYLVNEDAQLDLDSAEANQKLREAESAQCQAAVEAAQTNFDLPTHLQVPAADAEAVLAKIETAFTSLPFEIESAEARFRLAERDLSGKTKAGDAVSGLSLDQAHSEFDQAKAAMEGLRKQLPLLNQEREALVRKRDAARKRLELKTDEKKAVDEAEALLAAAEARLQSAKVAVAEAKLRLERMTILSPIDGRVLHLLTTPGTHVAGGIGRSGEHDGGVVVTLYQPDNLQIRVDVRFEDLPHVGRDQPVLVESPAIATPLKGRVLFQTSVADIQKNTLEVKVAIDEPPNVIKPEMLVDVTFQAPEMPIAKASESENFRLFIPKHLIENTETGAFVWLADMASGIARRQSVTTGPIQSKTMIEVIDGLTVASRLIVRGREDLQDGDRIEVTGEDGTAGIEAVSPDE